MARRGWSRFVEPKAESQFGMGCLLARRLIDEGATCVEVNKGGWDTPDDGLNRVTALNTDLDRGTRVRSWTT